MLWPRGNAAFLMANVTLLGWIAALAARLAMMHGHADLEAPDQPAATCGRGKTAGRGTEGSGACHTEPENFGWLDAAAPCGCRSCVASRTRSVRNATWSTWLDWVLFRDGGAVGVADLVAAGAVRPDRKVRILGSGDVSVPFQVTAHAFSASAKEKITGVGGSITEL
jgi:large subunit ribosomal protein L15